MVETPDPRGFSFEEWASLLMTQLTAYNVPAPEEDAWIDWACQLLGSPQLASLGLVDPRGFAGWREWAAQLVQDLSA